MATTGGFAPGTYQAADLNRQQAIFGSAGIARGMQVQPTSPAGLSVQVAVSAQGDGVCYLSNGGWVRIDAQLQLNVPSNSSGSTRNDAVVATMDPTGSSGPASVAYITNWAGGFGGGTTNQFVLALVSVANNAVSIVSGNITQNQAAASFGNASTAGTANTIGPIATSNGAFVSQVQTSTIGFGWGITDNTSSSLIEVMPVALSGTARGMQLDYTDAANVRHPGVLVSATAITAVGAVSASTYTGNVVADSGGSIFPKYNTVGMRIFAAGTTAGITFQKYDLFILLPFN